MQLFSPGRWAVLPSPSQSLKNPRADPQQPRVKQVRENLAQCLGQLLLTASGASGQLVGATQGRKLGKSGVPAPSPLSIVLDIRGQRTGDQLLHGRLPGLRAGLPPATFSGNPNHCGRWIAGPLLGLRVRSTPAAASLTCPRLILTNCACGKRRLLFAFLPYVPREPIRPEDLIEAPPLPFPRRRTTLFGARGGKGKGRQTGASRFGRLRPFSNSQSHARCRARARSLEFNGRERPLARP